MLVVMFGILQELTTQEVCTLVQSLHQGLLLQYGALHT